MLGVVCWGVSLLHVRGLCEYLWRLAVLVSHRAVWRWRCCCTGVDQVLTRLGGTIDLGVGMDSECWATRWDVSVVCTGSLDFRYLFLTVMVLWFCLMAEGCVVQPGHKNLQP